MDIYSMLGAGIPVARRKSGLAGAHFLAGTIVESWVDQGVTLHTVPRSQGTSPPVLTFGGTLTGGVFPYIQCDGAGALGVWTYKVSYDDGATFPHTGILSSGTPTALPGIGSAITVSAAAGDAATNNIWQPLVAQINDISGNANHATQATAANMAIARMVAFNGKKALDFGTGGSFGYATPAMSLGVHSVMMVARTDSGSTFVFRQYNGANRGHIYGSTGDSSNITRTTASTRDVSASWLRDGARKTFARTFDGTHAGHKIYVNGVDQNAANGTSGTSDPGTTPAASSVLYFGNYEGLNSGLRGLLAGWFVANRAWSALEVANLHTHATTRFPL